MPATPDLPKLQALLGTVVNEMGAAANACLVIIGDKLGLYETLARIGPASSAELARAADVNERYVREWLSAQTASGFIDWDKTSRKFSLSPEQAAVFADPDSPVNVSGAFDIIAAEYANRERLTRAFRTGEGIGWGEHCNCLFCGVSRFFRAGYTGHLIADWLPSIEGVVAKLEKGAKVVDIGCGHGASTEIMAKAFPNSEFIGFDAHGPSIDRARAECASLPNLRFEVATATDYPGRDYDFAAMFDALHDMGDPVSAARYARQSLRRDGVMMLVEPMAGDDLADNLNPVGRLYYAGSTQLCVPGSLSQERGMALGAQAGFQRLSDVIKEGGFGYVRRAAETPFNMVIEARP